MFGTGINKTNKQKNQKHQLSGGYWLQAAGNYRSSVTLKKDSRSVFSSFKFSSSFHL